MAINWSAPIYDLIIQTHSLFPYLILEKCQHDLSSSFKFRSAVLYPHNAQLLPCLVVFHLFILKCCFLESFGEESLSFEPFLLAKEFLLYIESDEQ